MKTIKLQRDKWNLACSPFSSVRGGIFIKYMCMADNEHKTYTVYSINGTVSQKRPQSCIPVFY